MLLVPEPDISRPHRAIILWLAAVAALVFALILVGGATRLTESGLSIVEWKPVTGVLPPLSVEAWQAEFEKYQTIPQYAQRNLGMSLADFKTIYWWEWTHRLLGRVIGAAYLLPFLWFLWRGWITPGLRPLLWGIFALGGLQGAVGWWMVASGLADRTEVSQYRLATHLLLACIIFAALIWTAQRISADIAMFGQLRGKGLGTATSIPTRRIRTTAAVLVVLVLLQIYLGALVAGLRAGLTYNTWPLIDGAFIPDAGRLFFDSPLWRNFFENTLTVQFDHRMVAYALWVLAVEHAADVWMTAKRGPVVGSAILLAAAVTLQATVGIATLLAQAPIDLALLHQAVAMLVLATAVIHAARLAVPTLPEPAPDRR
jgi:cytochrome c oxidase assembly protein subunit 15